MRRSPRHDSSLTLAAELLRGSQRTLALTGAGISTPSGIPDFRSERSGLWKHVDPLEVASIWGFHDHPERFYDWFRLLLARTATARPNAAHKALADMEAAGRLAGVVTQNIDSLHQAAGSRCVCELHGHMRTVTCLGCNTTSPSDGTLADVLAGLPPPRCGSCNELLKPDVVLFGEPLPYDMLSRAQEEALACDTMLIVGTSLEVMPAADLPLLARRRGAKLVLVNLTPTPLDDQMDLIVRADVVEALKSLAAALDLA
jgi:NAD-dependent deacetylase